MEPRFVDTPSLRRYVLSQSENEVNPNVVTGKILAEDLSVFELRVIADACFAKWTWEQLKRPHDPVPTVETSEKMPATVAPTFNDGAKQRTFVDSRGVPSASWRRNAFLDDYSRQLNKAVKTGDSVTDRKRLADCTVADLTWMANYRQAVAEKNLATATQCTDLAAALTKAGVETVAELPREVGEKILLR